MRRTKRKNTLRYKTGYRIKKLNCTLIFIVTEGRIHPYRIYISLTSFHYRRTNEQHSVEEKTSSFKCEPLYKVQLYKLFFLIPFKQIFQRRKRRRLIFICIATTVFTVDVSRHSGHRIPQMNYTVVI